jgi:uncharacterized protein
MKSVVIIDAFAFCRNSEQQAGKIRLPDLIRLHTECVSDEGSIAWMLAGEMSKQVSGYPALHLTVNGTVQLKCQRCLTPYVFQIESDTTLLLAKDEAAADQLDTLLQDEEFEIIVGSKTFDITALIEDEALLALPLSPRHAVCPDAVKLEAVVNVKQESPFAVLKSSLKI